MSGKKLFKVLFHNHNKIFEVYAKKVTVSDFYGFTEISDLVFGSADSILVDPSEEKLRDEFAQTQSLHLPMHSIIRIEEVKEQGTAKIRDASGEKVTPFPMPMRHKPTSSD